MPKEVAHEDTDLGSSADPHVLPRALSLRPPSNPATRHRLASQRLRPASQNNKAPRLMAPASRLRTATSARLRDRRSPALLDYAACPCSQPASRSPCLELSVQMVSPPLPTPTSDELTGAGSSLVGGESVRTWARRGAGPARPPRGSATRGAAMKGRDAAPACPTPRVRSR